MKIDEFVSGIVEKSSIPIISPQSDEIVSNVNKEIADFTSYLIKAGQEEQLYELLKKLPSALYFIKFDYADHKDVACFENCIKSLANLDRTFYLSIHSSHLFSKIFHQFSSKWAQEHASFFRNSTLSAILGGKSVSHTVQTFLEQFLENADLNGEMATNIHLAHRSESGNIVMNDDVALLVSHHVTEDCLHTLKSEFLDGNIIYVSANRTPLSLKITPEEVFDKFLGNEDINYLCKNADNIVKKCKILKRFWGRMSLDTEVQFLREIVLDCYSNNNRIGSLFKSLPTKLIDKHAHLALGISQWTFIHFSYDKKLELLNEINFDVNVGLLAYHPTPSEVPLAKWKEAIVKCEISHKAFPSHLLFGEQKLNEHELLELMLHTNGGRNKIFNHIQKEYPSIVTDSLLEKISESELQARNHPTVVKFATQRKRDLETASQINLLMSLAVKKDTSGVSTKIIELVQKAMLNKKSLSKVLETLIEER